MVGKHNEIVNSRQPANTSHAGHRTVVNVSSIVLSETENSLLEKGLNFTISKILLKAKEVIPSIEHAIKDLTPPEAEN